MTTLVIEPLKDNLSQIVNLKISKRCHVAAFYPYLYIHNNPPGVFRFSVLRGEETLFQKDFTSQNVKDALGTTLDFAHTFHPVIPNSPLSLDSGTYELRLSAVSGYSESGSSLIAWVRQHENIQAEIEGLQNGNRDPLSVRIKTYRRVDE